MTSEPRQSSVSDLLHVTMTLDAALRFQAALYHAAVRIENEEHAEWLRWGASRVTYAQIQRDPRHGLEGGARCL